MNKTIRTGLISALLGMAALAAMPTMAAEESTLQWPQLLPDGRGQRGAKALRLEHLTAQQIHVTPSEKTDSQAASWPVELKDGKGMIRSRSGQQGGYHWVSAREERADVTRIANTLVYFSNPGPAPRDLLEGSKAELEISPLSLPREHAHYRAGETWPFQVRLRGEALKYAPVSLVTSQGTELELATDEAGRLNVIIPDDFKQQDHAEGGGHGQQQTARFLLGTVVMVDGKRLISAFNYSYVPGPYANKSLLLGSVTLFLGMGTAGALFLRKKPSARRPS